MTQSTNNKPPSIFRLSLLVLCALSPSPVRAERLAISPTAILASWTYPAGAVQLDPTRPLRPVLIGKNIDPLSGGTVRRAGAALTTATR